MYTTFSGSEIRQYSGIFEEDAYHIALQVLDEMQQETFNNPEAFKNDGFSKLYNWLIYKVQATGERITEVKNEN